MTDNRFYIFGQIINGMLANNERYGSSLEIIEKAWKLAEKAIATEPAVPDLPTGRASVDTLKYNDSCELLVLAYYWFIHRDGKIPKDIKEHSLWPGRHAPSSTAPLRKAIEDFIKAV